MSREPADGVRILLVDDQPSQLVAHQTVLSDLGEVVTATGGAQALRYLLKQEFAVVLLDVNMPGMDGFETAALIRKRKSCENTPIIFVTAYPDELQAARGYSLGAVDYILAPIVPDVLRGKVRTVIELYRKTAKIRQQAERLRKRTEQLGSITSQLIQVEDRERARLARILHDHVQQLLAAASVRVQIARRQTNDAEVSTMLGEVDDLIAQSIAAARSLSVELHPPVLDSGLVPALDWLARHMEKRCRLSVELRAETSPELAPAPRVFLFDAVRELLLNVVKHAGVDGCRITLSEAAHRVLTIAVEDKGMGFDPDKAIRPDASTEHSGFRNIREKLVALDGELSVDSRPGHGACVTIRLPIEERVTEALAKPLGDAIGLGEGDADRNAPIRVLLVDDHEILRKGIRSLLQSHTDIEVVGEAADGLEAVDLARRLVPHVVIMDLSMPRLDGIEATRAIVQERPETRVIGLSMRDGDDAAAAMRNAGAFAHVAKGGPPESLITVIRRSRTR